MIAGRSITSMYFTGSERRQPVGQLKVSNQLVQRRVQHYLGAQRL